MILLIVFAFLAGVVTILSPCILPILPIVLSGSVGEGKKKPLGVVTGFVLSFTFFTLFLSAIVRSTGLSADALRTFSVVIIVVFGLSLLVSQTQVIIEKLFSKLSGLLPQQSQKTGFGGGLLIGLSLGLVWTPCVGPILASVISLALSGSVSGQALAITLAYALGTAVPMLAVMSGGRQLLQRVPWLTANTATIQKAFGVLMILTAIGIFYNLDRKFQTYILEIFPQYGVGLTRLEDNPAVNQQLENLNSGSLDRGQLGKPMSDVVGDNYQMAPELILGGQWFNLPDGQPSLSLQQLRGKVVLVDFWTYTCINCIRTLPYLKTWHQKYADQGLVIIGVHSPEFEFEKSPQNLQMAITDFGLEYPVMQDNDFATWRAYNNRYWPAKYLIDKNGQIRYSHFGEGQYDQTEEMIQTLLAETGVVLDSLPITNPEYTVSARTPELYLGYNRIEYLISRQKQQLQLNQPTDFVLDPTSQLLHHFQLAGNWTIDRERALPDQAAELELTFEAQEVFLVMRATSGSGQVEVRLDDQPIADLNVGEDVIDGVVTVNEDRLYKLIKLPAAGSHRLNLKFLGNNLELYAFTFG